MDRPDNTGAAVLPPAQPALIWYPYADSAEFPELGTGGRTAMAGPVYHFDPQLSSDIKLPEYFDDTLFMYEWSRNQFWEVKLDEHGELLKINPVFSALEFDRPIDVELGPDGALYVLEWGSNFGGNNADAILSRVEFIGNLPGLTGDYNGDNAVDAADFVVWRKTDGSTTDLRADGNGDGVVNAGDYSVWRANFGATLQAAGAGRGAAVGTLSTPVIQAANLAQTETDAVVEQVASLAIFERSSETGESDSPFRRRINSSRVVDSDSDDLLLLAIDQISQSRQQNVQGSAGRENIYERSDDADDPTVVDELLSLALSSWR